ncbi:MAG: hypothetical protein MK198_09620 [Gracilimonas sp.]|uniref:hypothetical protein n=1 Tax=Gracilimonas sp. TaxID=1974203 RepID=UPI0037534EC2|nr:hypothetical protein [Gracilimonas sp.]
MEQQISTKYRNFYREYIQKLSIDHSIKSRILDERIFSGDYKFYLFYPRLFSEAFNIVDDRNLKLLSISGFLYYLSLISLDRIYDSREEELSHGNLAIITTCQEESIKILSYLFEPGSEFWKYWNKRKSKYYSAMSMENNGFISSESQYFKLADYKSEFGKVAIDALHLLSQKKYTSRYKDLLLAHRHFSIANQIVDDIQDITLDREQGQFNWVFRHLSSFLESNDLNCSKMSSTQIKKYLYSSNLAVNYYIKAGNFYNSALKHAEKAQATLFHKSLKKLHKENDHRINTINGYNMILETRAKVNKSKIRKRASFLKKLSMDELDHSLQDGINYLRSTIDDTYKWHDFLTNAGLSTGWVTSYVGFQLSEAGLASDLVKDVIDRLLREENIISVGAYNESMIHDADSLNFAVALSGALDIDQQRILLDSWFDFQGSDGGWMTYNKPDALRARLEFSADENVKGWTESHPCVSAVAAYILNYMGKYQNRYKKTIKYLLSCQTEAGYVPSYWWTNSAYSTSFFIMSLAKGNDHSSELENAKKWLIDQQNSDGSWPISKYSFESSAFYTALAVKVLIKTSKEEYNANIVKGLLWLLNNQLKDGSWPVAHILRIPATDVVNPEQVSQWRESSFGVNALIDDHIGNFTTATVLNTFSCYLRSIGSNIESKDKIDYR